MTAAAYVLMQEIRLRAARTQCARAQVWVLRERLLKLGAHVVRSVRRVVLHLPHSFPFSTPSDKSPSPWAREPDNIASFPPTFFAQRSPAPGSA